MRITGYGFGDGGSATKVTVPEKGKAVAV